jgi:hypothetical protein
MTIDVATGLSRATARLTASRCPADLVQGARRMGCLGSTATSRISWRTCVADQSSDYCVPQVRCVRTFFTVIKGAPAARQSSGLPGRIRRRKRGIACSRRQGRRPGQGPTWVRGEDQVCSADLANAGAHQDHLRPIPSGHEECSAFSDSDPSRPGLSLEASHLQTSLAICSVGHGFGKPHRVFRIRWRKRMAPPLANLRGRLCRDAPRSGVGF